jgi:NADH:flavin oxidoreductases, Old Yellow Enzyme family
MKNKLFEPTQLGKMKLSNRIVMAPLTRSRAIGNIPNELMAEYYSARATAGLIIAEGTSPSPNGLGYPRIPGIYSEAQVKAWKTVTDAVHKKGGHIFVQLMHTGRVSHTANMPEGAKILSASGETLAGKMYTDQHGEQPFGKPSEMTTQEIKAAISEYSKASTLAIEAGFDGVELHGANGYLIEQFLNPASNKRTDEYGGSNENRMRFAIEVAKATVDAIDKDKVGIRVSPYGVFNGSEPFADTDQFYGDLATKLSALGLTYIHVVDHSSMGTPPVSQNVKNLIHQNFKGTYIMSGGYDREKAEADLAENRGDLVAFGRPFISNPDLVEKLKTGAPLKQPDHSTFYTPGPKGYTDY